jgi:predicted dithiol-disulfide oxidoreductase (DUF899 family)
MEQHNVVSQKEWFQAHKAHLAREKELTHFRDQVAAERLALPWYKIERQYTFDTEAGKKSLPELFGANSQLIVYHFMLAPQSPHRCPGCSILSDHIDGANQHIAHHDVTLLVASRAPLSEILPFKKRMGWQFDWVSSGNSEFNYDMQVSFNDSQVAAGTITYNYEERTGLKPDQIPRDLPGISSFYKDEHGDVFLTFQARARGGDLLIGVYNYLDIAPKGRNETGTMNWVHLHDQYPAQR